MAKKRNKKYNPNKHVKLVCNRKMEGKYIALVNRGDSQDISEETKCNVVNTKGETYLPTASDAILMSSQAYKWTVVVSIAFTDQNGEAHFKHTVCGMPHECHHSQISQSLAYHHKALAKTINPLHDVKAFCWLASPRDEDIPESTIQSAYIKLGVWKEHDS